MKIWQHESHQKPRTKSRNGRPLLRNSTKTNQERKGKTHLARRNRPQTHHPRTSNQTGTLKTNKKRYKQHKSRRINKKKKNRTGLKPRGRSRERGCSLNNNQLFPLPQITNPTLRPDGECEDRIKKEACLKDRAKRRRQRRFQSPPLFPLFLAVGSFFSFNHNPRFNNTIKNK